jgi:hypothetical protein
MERQNPAGVAYCGLRKWTRDMAQLTFYCPYTNLPIASGIDIDVRSLQNVGDCPISLFCPHCGFDHHGVIADGCLSSPDKPSRGSQRRPSRIDIEPAAPKDAALKSSARGVKWIRGQSDASSPATTPTARR